MGAGLGAEPDTPVKCIDQSLCPVPLAWAEKPCDVKPQMTVTIMTPAMSARKV
jgi:hypothetical protein